ncbi:hypothetical protein BH10BAC5_BH10BAC5_02870 [soil metagenome]
MFLIRSRKIFPVLFLLAGIIFYSCEKKSDSVIDPFLSAPVISNAGINVDTVRTTGTTPSIRFIASVNASITGTDAIKNISCKLIDPSGSSIGTFILNDSGISPDTTAGNGIYTGNIDAGTISCLIVGTYSLQYIAESNAGLFSNQINLPVFVKNINNQAIIISNPQLPDSVVRPTSGSFDITLKVTVIDPDGSCDINSVFFDAFRPSGSFIFHFPMQAGSEANTFFYTAPVTPAPADSSYGYFKYNFSAVDNSGLLSNILKDSIKFVRP